MRKEEKNAIIDSLSESIQNSKHFYLADTSELNAEDTSLLRRKCFEKEIKLIVVKNTLLKEALKKCDENYEELYGVLKNSTSLMLCDTSNLPAKLIKEFNEEHDKPVLKAAYVEETFYVGENYLDDLVKLKSKEELVADIIALLQSPAKNVISSLQSGGQVLSGVIKTLSERK